MKDNFWSLRVSLGGVRFWASSNFDNPYCIVVKDKGMYQIERMDSYETIGKESHSFKYLSQKIRKLQRLGA